jgi:hypothetical protein
MISTAPLDSTSSGKDGSMLPFVQRWMMGFARRAADMAADVATDVVTDVAADVAADVVTDVTADKRMKSDDESGV